MATQEYLDNAPISEAIIEIRCQLPEDNVLSTLKLKPQKISEMFEIRNALETVTGQFTVDRKEKSSSQSINSRPIGYSYLNKDGDKVLQFRVTGFTYAKRKPYESWGELVKEAKEFWEVFKSHAKPIKIVRIAVRYINTINLDISSNSSVELDDYFEVTPQIPKTLPQTIHNFEYNIALPNSDIGCGSMIRQHGRVVDKDNKLSAEVVLDIDVFKQVNLDPSKEDVVWKSLEELRDFKNNIFFSFITEKTKRLFK